MPVPLSSGRRGGREGTLEAIEVAQGDDTDEEGIVRLEAQGLSPVFGWDSARLWERSADPTACAEAGR